MFDKPIEPSTSPEVCAAMQDFGVSKVASGPLSVKTRDGVKPCSEITALNDVFILFFYLFPNPFDTAGVAAKRVRLKLSSTA